MAPDGTDALVAMDADGPTEKRIELDRGTSISVTPLYGVHGAIPLSQSVFAGRFLELKYMYITRRTRCCGHRRSCPHARNGAMVGSANAQDHVCARHARTGAQAGEAMPKTALGVARARLQPTGTAARA